MISVQFHEAVPSGKCTFCGKSKQDLLEVSFSDGSIAGTFDKTCLFQLVNMKLAPMNGRAARSAAAPGVGPSADG